MTIIKASTRWYINVVSFVLFIVLSVTGSLNWLVLPRGFEARNHFLVSVRHFLIAIHEWTGLLFIGMIILHLFLHWGYIKSQFRMK